jgi:hypothetical protein
VQKFLVKCWKLFVAWDPIKNFIDDLSSLRALWCWIFLTLFLVSFTFIVYTNPTAHEAALMILGGMVSWIFSNYVISNSMEKKWGVDRGSKKALRDFKHTKPVDASKESEEGA